MEKINALVPMKEHSERIPKKNIRDFCGKPLYHHILDSLTKSKYITNIYINTDSNFIMEDASNNFNVNIIKRPKKLRSDLIPMNDIIHYDLSIIEGEYFLQTHSTNPLLKTKTIDKAIEMFFLNINKNDSLFSVTPLKNRFYYPNLKPVNHSLDKLIRTQDLSPILEENSNLYIFSRESFNQTNNRIGKKPILFQIQKNEAIDIDEEIDFFIAEQIYKKYTSDIKVLE